MGITESGQKWTNFDPPHFPFLRLNIPKLFSLFSLTLLLSKIRKDQAYPKPFREGFKWGNGKIELITENGERTTFNRSFSCNRSDGIFQSLNPFSSRLTALSERAAYGEGFGGDHRNRLAEGDPGSEKDIERKTLCSLDPRPMKTYMNIYGLPAGGTKFRPKNPLKNFSLNRKRF